LYGHSGFNAGIAGYSSGCNRSAIRIRSIYDNLQVPRLASREIALKAPRYDESRSHLPGVDCSLGGSVTCRYHSLDEGAVRQDPTQVLTADGSLIMVNDDRRYSVHVKIHSQSKYAQLHRGRNEQKGHHATIPHGVSDFLQSHGVELNEPSRQHEKSP
jgi:hypothetical protein